MADSPDLQKTMQGEWMEALYQQFLLDPGLVEPDWCAYFNALTTESVATPSVSSDKRQIAVLQLINAYRFLGVRQADLDPLHRFAPANVPELDPAYYGLTDEDANVLFETGSLCAPAQATLEEILVIVKRAYCGTLSAEYMYISDYTRKRWLQQRLEGDLGVTDFAVAEQLRIMQDLTAAETLEKFLHTRYVGQKRFSLEGAETLIPMLHHLVEAAAGQEVKEIVLGMAHRGRINVLVNLLGKPLQQIFGALPADTSNALSGDVKYHQGFSTDVQTANGTVHLTLAFNPSHLEIVHPVVRGSARARQQRRGDTTGSEVMPVIIHGDAAFSGQGVVMESFNMSETRGYDTGGGIHIVVNNQIGFTTSDTRDSRSSLYCTDVAKLIEAPVLHVNGDDPEAALLAIQIALDYRQKFHKNIIIDLVCFRRHGHNEQDEPAVTQPLMYHKIDQHPGTRALYAEKLIARGKFDLPAAQAAISAYRNRLELEQRIVTPVASLYKRSFAAHWLSYRRTDWRHPADTSVSSNRLAELGEKIIQVPDGFALHPRVEKIMADRRAMLQGDIPVDWGMAENLAYASLLRDGYPVRISGQDSGRGTFFHRHAVLHDQFRERWDAGEYLPLQHIYPNQPHFLVIDSLLSELAVLAFEYGYATAEPDELVVWEAQFGDFANGAQVVIDQFIASGEAKWGRLCGLTLFLPHGQEGQGPEHSSARLERFLQLCANDNMQVCQPTNAAQMFHLLRRQMLRPYRKPLIAMTPKSLLRAKHAGVSLSNLTHGGFAVVLAETKVLDRSLVRRVVVCTGKVYFDLFEAREQRGITDVALLRIEQLYPFPDIEFKAELAFYPQAQELVWAQEEPRNQGAWFALEYHLRLCMPTGQILRYAGRPFSASPAVGYPEIYQAQRQALIDEALS
ncbi:MAG: 2-oxoglutarate dehydrogenase E1 component [Sulfuriferula sp.]